MTTVSVKSRQKPTFDQRLNHNQAWMELKKKVLKKLRITPASIYLLKVQTKETLEQGVKYVQS